MLPRVTSDIGKFDRGLTQLLHEKLHWFDVRDRVTFKLVVMVHRRLNGRAPQYLAVHCVPLSSHRHLRSAERNLLHRPTTSPTQHVWPPAFCHCRSVRLEQSSGPCPQSELHRSCFQAPARHFSSHGSSAPSVLGVGSLVMRHINRHIEIDSTPNIP